ncbi:GIY-YIG nuclease family protein [Chryseobacterium sp. StRB126]
MKQYFVYILRCSDNSYYTGVTSDIETRFSQHQSGKFP